MGWAVLWCLMRPHSPSQMDSAALKWAWHREFVDAQPWNVHFQVGHWAWSTWDSGGVPAMAGGALDGIFRVLSNRNHSTILSILVRIYTFFNNQVQDTLGFKKKKKLFRLFPPTFLFSQQHLGSLKLREKPSSAIRALQNVSMSFRIPLELLEGSQGVPLFPSLFHEYVNWFRAAAKLCGGIPSCK